MLAAQQPQYPHSAWSGVFCATLTPFVSEVGTIDPDWIPGHLRFLESHGVAGVLPLGTTGEGPSCSLDERKRVLDTVLAHRNTLRVLAGTGCTSLAETIELSRYATEQGADAVLVMPPFYYRTVAEAGIIRYYQAVCDALPGDARLILYHIPAMTGVPITPTILDYLLTSHGPQIAGIKDSSGDPCHTAELVQRYPGLAIYSGSDSHAASSLAVGVVGVISALANAWPDRVCAVFQASRRGGDVAAAQAPLSAAREAVRGFAIPAVLKAVLPWTSGLPRTSVRAPLSNLSDEETVQLREGLGM
ncbi:MAG: dihydrodipicolinate synthase family protein [Chloroflexaceae bacterium]|nr:dihydrodipicolinate synthase family protein [Chloroflexaceae bacterium]